MTGTPLDAITRVAEKSTIFRYPWKDRGVAPAGYTKGMALVYARVLGKLKVGDPAALEMAKADSGDPGHDALSFYGAEFRHLGLANDATGADTLRHVFALLLGLGMRESSGKYCEGRDRSANNVTADTAEAGAFQASFNARTAHPQMEELFTSYSANRAGFVDVFKEGVHCSAASLENYGTGPGFEFQALSKACPAFAAEFAAVGTRHIRRHWGPIDRKDVELMADADRMFFDVQSIITDSPSIQAAVA